MLQQLMMMSIVNSNEKSWDQLWFEFKTIFQTENTYLFHKWVEDNNLKPKR
jgi:hypothetical protein